MESVDEPVENAWMRSHGQCEGRQGLRPQGHRCGRDLVWEHRGQSARPDAWEAHYKTPRVLAGWEAVKQIEILCWDCYQEVARTANPAPRIPRDRAPAPVGQGGAVLGRPALLLQRCESG